MNKISDIKDQLTSEISQKNELQKKLILQILCSKRLLSEHLESLEEVSNILLGDDKKATNYLTLVTATSAVASSYVVFQCFSNNFRYIFPCFAGAVPVLYLKKRLSLQQRNYYESSLKDFIRVLDEFEFSVKKSTNFINDAQHIKSQAEILNRCNHGKSISSDIINSLKRVIRALYCFVKYLEYCCKIDEKFEYFYQEIDDVDNCELLNNIDDENISSNKFKEIFNLFAYVQSYALLRLGLVFATNLEEGKYIIKKKICDLTSKVKIQMSLLPNFLLIQKEEAEIQENIQKLINAEINKTMSKDLLQIRSSTTDFTLKTLSLLLHLKNFQEIIAQATSNNQNKKELNDALNSLENIGSQLSLCSDEQTRLLILIKKFLNKDFEEIKVAEKEIMNEVPEKSLKIIDDVIQPQKDEFFYVDPQRENLMDEKDDGEQECEKKFEDLDEEDLQIKLTKKHFKPVLAQLRERIVPIDADMKEREKTVLRGKGIEIPSEEDRLTDDSWNMDDDEFGSDIDMKHKEKCDQNQKKYDESRSYLEAKNQINIFAQTRMFPTRNNFMTLEEEILE